MSTAPSKELLSDESIPRITLGGIEWPVPRLAIAQTSTIEPLLLKHLGAIAHITQVNIDNLIALKAGKSALDLHVSPQLTPEVMQDMATVAYWALRRGHWDPNTKTGITREEFDAMPIMWEELHSAAFIVGRQAGVFKPAKSNQNGVSHAAVPLAEVDTTMQPTG